MESVSEGKEKEILWRVKTTNNDTETGVYSKDHLNHLFTRISLTQLISCILSVAVNLMVFMSAWWCKKPISPGLVINVSLVLACLLEGFFLAIDLTLEVVIPALFQNPVVGVCFPVVLNILRQGCTLISALHLTAIQINAWMVLAKPSYSSIMTLAAVRRLVCIIWFGVILGAHIYFFVYGGFSWGCPKYDALLFLLWKSICSVCSSISFLCMVLVYFHLQKLVSSRMKTTGRGQSSDVRSRRRYATLTATCTFLLVTFMIGILPETLWNVLVCQDCVFRNSQVHIWVRTHAPWIFRTILILKTLFIPIIFALRIPDITVSLKRMTCRPHRLCELCSHKTSDLHSV